jgi:hypothetical protein
MTTHRPLQRSITGRPEVHLIFREEWPDHIDNHGEACPVCQLEGRTIECNVYVPTYDGGTDLLNTCRCCAPHAVVDHGQLDPGRDAIIEYAKEN